MNRVPAAAGHRLRGDERVQIASSVASITASNSGFSRRARASSPRERAAAARPFPPTGRGSRSRKQTTKSPDECSAPSRRSARSRAPHVREPVALARQERSIGRDDDDDRARAPAALGRAVRRRLRRSARPRRHRSPGALLPPAVVRLYEHADREAAVLVATTREEVPIPPLKPWQIMPVPPPTSPRRPARRRRAAPRGRARPGCAGRRCR